MKYIAFDVNTPNHADNRMGAVLERFCIRYRDTVKGIFLDRPNRFIAHVQIGDKTETVHVKNTGRCRELLIEGAEVFTEVRPDTATHPAFGVALQEARERGVGVVFLQCHVEPDALNNVKGSAKYPDLSGMVRFYQTRRGVLVCAEISGLPEVEEPCGSGIFAFHIHSGSQCTGDSTDPFADALTHYDPGKCPYPGPCGRLGAAVLESWLWVSDLPGGPLYDLQDRRQNSHRPLRTG